MHGGRDLETLTPKSAEELGVRLYPSPPRGFDPARAIDSELLEYGYPPRPDADSQPAVYGIWRLVTSPSITRIEPVFGVFPGWPGEPGGLVGTGGQPPAAGTSGKWAGSVAYADERHPFETVLGQWTVPDIRPASGPSGEVFACGSWVGFDGATEDPQQEQQIVQAGTNTQLQGTNRQTSAWWEWYPMGAVTIENFSVQPGDVITCWVNANSRDEYGFINEAGFILHNLTSGLVASFAKPRPTTFPGYNYTVPAVGINAEWILEAPTETGEQVTLGQFGAVYFTGSASRLSTGQVVDAGEGEMLTLVDSYNVDWLVPQSLGSTTFIVPYRPPESAGF